MFRVKEVIAKKNTRTSYNIIYLSIYISIYDTLAEQCFEKFILLSNFCRQQSNQSRYQYFKHSTSLYNIELKERSPVDLIIDIYTAYVYGILEI